MELQHYTLSQGWQRRHSNQLKKQQRTRLGGIATTAGAIITGLLVADTIRTWVTVAALHCRF